MVHEFDERWCTKTRDAGENSEVGANGEPAATINKILHVRSVLPPRVDPATDTSLAESDETDDTDERATISHNGGSPDHLQGYGSIRRRRPA